MTLKSNNLIAVSFKEFQKQKLSQINKSASENPEDPNTICYMFENYPGLFRDLNNKLHDLRPHDDKNLKNWLE